MRRLIAVVAALGVALAATAVAAPANTKIKPKAGGYAGKVTNKNGTGKINLSYATFAIGGKSKKAIQLFNWTGHLKCSGGRPTIDTNAGITAPLKGVKFSGKETQGPSTVTLSGRWTSNTKITGTVRVKTTGPTTCDTGPVTFSAKHV